MNEEQFWNKLGRYFAGELPETEKQKMEQWIRSDPEIGEMVDRLNEIWNQKSDDHQWDTEAAWQKVKFRMKSGRETKSFNKSSKALIYHFKQHWDRYSLIAGVAAAIIIGIMFNPLWEDEPMPYLNEAAPVEFITVKGERRQIKLDDGTKVFLNADSRVIVANNFMKEHRFVYLQGEAYFEVADHDEFPFVIYASGFVTIAEKPASFNINAFREQDDVILSVKEGSSYVTKIKETDEAAPNEIPLIDLRKPMKKIQPSREAQSAEAIVYNKKNESFDKVESENPKEFFGWTKGILYFSKDDLITAAKKIERWYGMEVEYDTCNVKEAKTFSGEFKNPELDNVLASLSTSTDVHYLRQGDSIKLEGMCN